MLSTDITTWVLVASAASAKIYEKEKGSCLLKIHTEFSHPEGKALVHDLVTDHPGHYAAGSASGTFSQDHNPKDNENTQFAHELTKFLDHARATNQFDELIIICLPHFYGLIEKHMGKELQKKLVRHMMKDYMHSSAQELTEKLFPPIAD